MSEDGTVRNIIPSSQHSLKFLSFQSLKGSFLSTQVLAQLMLINIMQ